MQLAAATNETTNEIKEKENKTTLSPSELFKPAAPAAAAASAAAAAEPKAKKKRTKIKRIRIFLSPTIHSSNNYNG